MKYLLFILAIVFLSGVGVWYVNSRSSNISNLPEVSFPKLKQNPKGSSSQDVPLTFVVAQDLDTPWAIAFLPDGGMLVTERKGTVRLVSSDGKLQVDPVATLSQVKEIGEGGLLGITLHPDFSSNNLVYLYYTYQGEGGSTFNRVVRMTYEDGRLFEEKVIVDYIPAASNHNGGRIRFGPDGYLYITTGDAQVSSQAQDKESLAGKILRVDAEGNPAPGNPFNNRTFTYGHRNPQGLAWSPDASLWETEHGRSGVLSGLDEINLIEKGGNYGWPEIEGDETRQGMVTPIRNSGPTTTWAPSGLAYLNDSLYFGGLRGQALYEAVLNGNSVTEVKEHFKREFGRIRDVVVGPDGMLYITTSNRDGRGNPGPEDDRIIRVNPERL